MYSMQIILKIHLLIYSYFFRNSVLFNKDHLVWISYLSHHCICVAIYFCPYHFPVLSSFMTYHRVVTRLTRRVPLVEQELLTLSEHLSSPPVFSGVRVTRSLVLYVCFVDRCLFFCTFTFVHCIVCSSLIYRFWLHLWYLQTLLKRKLM